MLTFFSFIQHAILHMQCVLGAFYFLLGNLHPRLRSKIGNIQLLLLTKASMVTEFGIDHLLEPIVEDIQKLESVCHNYLESL